MFKKLAIKTLHLQLIIISACIIITGLWASRFPYPSPLIFELLDPKKRWPTQQVADWVLSGNIDEGFMTFFYRDPDRIIAQGDNMVAPADGEIIEMVEKDGILHIVIALTFWDVHVQRSPVKGTVVKVEDLGDTLMDGEGRNLVFLQEKMSPVQKAIHIQSDWGLIKVRLITSFLARRIEVWPAIGEVIEKGQRLGLIHLGSTVVVDVPMELTPNVKIGDRVVAGETILYTRN